MRRLISMPPALLILLLLALASGGMVAVMPYTVAKGTSTWGVALAPEPTVVVPPAKQYCLSSLPPRFYSEYPADRARAAPFSKFKESKNAFGPSAVPLRWGEIDAERRLGEVQHEFIRRHCGDGTDGGDKKLFQVGFLGSDVKHLTAAPTHPHMNPNVVIGREEWKVGLDGYLSAIRWDLSYLTYEKLGRDTWTLIMVHRDGQEPLVRAVKHEQPLSVYLMLAVTQPDGTIHFDRRRVNCGYQPTYTSYEDVPAAYK